MSCQFLGEEWFGKLRYEIQEWKISFKQLTIM